MEKKWQVKTLEEIATDIYSGSEITKEQLGSGNFPAIKCGDINSKLPLQFTECVSFVDENLINNKKYFEYGDLLISNLSNKLETVATSVAYVGDKKCLAGLGVTVIKHNQNPKYLAYVLRTKFCRKQIEKLTLRGTVFNFWNQKIKQIQIPLPSLEDQAEIVSKLDKFYDLIGNLELGIPWLIKANREQYEYYKNQIIRMWKI